MGIPGSRKIMGSWRKEWRLERAWCVRSRQSYPRGQEHSILVCVCLAGGSRRRGLPRGVRLWRIWSFQVYILPSTCHHSTFQGLVTSNLSIPVCNPLYKELFKAKGLSSLLPPEQWTWLCPRLDICARLLQLCLEKGWGPDVGAPQTQSIGYNQKPGRTSLLMTAGSLNYLWEKEFSEKSKG